MSNTQLVTKSLIEIESANFELISIVIGKEVFFPAIDIAKRMEYNNAQRAVSSNISDMYKLSYQELINKIKACSKEATSRSPMTESDLIVGLESHLNVNTKLRHHETMIFTDRKGFFELLGKSKLPIACELNEIFFTEVLPALSETGVYVNAKLQSQINSVLGLPTTNQLSQEKEDELRDLINQKDKLVLEISELKKDNQELEDALTSERIAFYIKELDGFGEASEINVPNALGKHRPSDICKLFGFSSSKSFYPCLRKYGIINSRYSIEGCRIPTDLAFDLNLVKFKNNYSVPMFTDIGLATLFVLFYNNGIQDPYYLDIFKQIFKLKNYDINVIKKNAVRLNKIVEKSVFSIV